MSQVNTVWEINGQSLELDLQDAETAEKYEVAFANMTENEKTLPNDGKPSAYIRAYHEMFVSLFDDLFGAGVGLLVLGEKGNSRICNEVYEQFLEFVSAQKAATMDSKNNMISRFSANRAQRRAEAKSK